MLTLAKDVKSASWIADLIDGAADVLGFGGGIYFAPATQEARKAAGRPPGCFDLTPEEALAEWEREGAKDDPDFPETAIHRATVIAARFELETRDAEAAGRE